MPRHTGGLTASAARVAGIPCAVGKDVQFVPAYGDECVPILRLLAAYQYVALHFPLCSLETPASWRRQSFE